MSSRYGSHALAAGARPGRSSAAVGGSVVDSLAGLAVGPESVVDSLAGFAAGPESVVDRLAGFGARRVRGARTAIPAAFRYELAVSRRTPVASWIRRSDHPSRPSASTCCFFSSLKTFTLGGGPQSRRRRQTSCAAYDWPVFRCPSLAGFGCPPRPRRDTSCLLMQSASRLTRRQKGPWLERTWRDPRRRGSSQRAVRSSGRTKRRFRRRGGQLE